LDINEKITQISGGQEIGSRIQVSDTLGYTETQVIHMALAKLAREVIPAYEVDEGDLTEKQLAAIRKAVPQGKSRSVISSLF